MVQTVLINTLQVQVLERMFLLTHYQMEQQHIRLLQQLRLLLAGQNDAPTANDDTINVTVGTPATGNVITSSDTDPDSDSLTVSAIAGGSVGSAVTGTYGTFTLNSNGSYTYTVDTTNSDVIAWQSGDAVLTETFTYTVSDGNGGTDTATITVNASGQNDAPTVVNDTDSVTEGGTVIETTNSQGTVLSDDSDVDGDSLTVSGTVSQTSATANGGSSITISSPNSASVGSAVTGYYGQLTLDSDGTYSYVANQSTANALDDSESGTDVFTFTVSDGTTTTSSTITITVNGQNDAPTVVNDTDSVTEGGTVIETTNSQGTVLSDDSDVDGDSLTVSGTVSQTSATANGGSSITISSPNSASVGSAVTGYYGQLTLDSDGTYSYVANQSTANALDDSESGTDVFTFTVSDGTTTTSSTITITVNGQNDAPTVVNDTDSVTEGGTVIETTNSQGTVLSDDSDVDGDSLTVSGTVSQTSATANGGSSITISSPNSASVGSAVTGYYGQLTLDSDGTYSYVANQSTANALDDSESGTDVFTFTVSDGTTTTSSTITITVNGQNDAPTVVNDTDSVTEGGTVIETTNSQGTVLSDDSDVDGDSLTVSGTVSQTSATANGGSSITISSPNSASVGSAVTGYYGQLTLDSDGTYSYVANQSTANALDDSESGTDVFTFTVSDGTTTTSSTITITVNGQNDAPTANDDTINVTVGTPATGNVITSSDTDPDSDSLTVSAIAGGSVGSAVTGTYGTFTLNSNGSYTYTVDTTNSDVIAWQSGDAVLTETFTYTVSDGTATDTATITVNASGQNDAPTANDDTINVTVGTPATGNVITSSDTDPDSDSLTVSAIAGGSVGSAVTGTYGTFHSKL